MSTQSQNEIADSQTECPKIVSKANDRLFRVLNLIVLLLCGLLAQPLRAQVDSVSTDTIDRLSDNFVHASLMVAAPGDVLYSVLGHACIRLQCPTYDLDYCFSYESEDVSQKVFQFLLGKLKMGMFAVPTEEYLQAFANEQRGVTEYPMNLPPAVKQELWRVLDNHLMEGANLEYDCIHRGCAISCVHSLHEALDTIPIVYAPFSDELQRCTMRELFYNKAPKSWNLFFCMSLVGGEGDRQMLPEEKLIIPTDLVETWQQAQVAGKPLLGEGMEIVPNTPRQSFPLSPMIVFSLLLALSVLNLWAKTSFLDYLSLVLQTLMGLLITYLVLFSSLPGTEWNWLIIPFNPLPAIAWHWRKYWANAWAAVLVVWCIVVVLMPHRLVMTEHILWVLSFVLVLLKPQIKKWFNKGCSKNSPFRYFVINWDVSPLFERFVVFICICLPFTQSQCSHCSFVQATHLLNKNPQIISKAIFRTSLYYFGRRSPTRVICDKDTTFSGYTQMGVRERSPAAYDHE